jgi:hypothetical protein
MQPLTCTTLGKTPARALIAAAFAAATVGAGSAQAQSISPPIVEHTERARSSFQITNPSLFPVNVVLDVRGFRVSEEGGLADIPIDSSGVNVKLSAMSFRVPPRQTYTVFYEAEPVAQAPAWFQVIASISGMRTESGINLRIELPHVVYLNQRQPLRRSEIEVRSFRFDSLEKKVHFEVENIGPHLGRITEVSVVAEGASEYASPFPFFPLSKRRGVINWPHDTAPERLLLRGAGFNIETALPPPSPGG